MKRFKCKLPYEGSPVLIVDAYDVDGAMDAAARKYGWSCYDEMRQNHEKTGAWNEDGGFTVQLVREEDESMNPLSPNSLPYYERLAYGLYLLYSSAGRPTRHD